MSPSEFKYNKGALRERARAHAHARVRVRVRVITKELAYWKHLKYAYVYVSVIWTYECIEEMCYI